MRMWNVLPELLCRQHLTGEHVEMHMFIGTLQMGNKMTGYIDGGLVEIHNIRKRHNELAVEMTRRGMNHQSPIEPEVDSLLYEAGSVDVNFSLADLRQRCEDCKQLQFLNNVPIDYTPEVMQLVGA